MMGNTSTPSPQAANTTTVTCPNCGGRVEYDAKSGQFLCTSCRSVQQIAAPKSTVDEYSINDYRIREKTGAQLDNVTVAVCQSCGGEIYFDPHETAKQCPMCGSSQIRAAEAASGIAPEGIVPFRFDSADAQQRFRQWIAKRWFAPNLLKKAYSEGRLEGLYVPYWTFDADTCADYIGQGGRTRVERDREGHTRTHTDWFGVSGRVYQKFDDILVCASQKRSGTVAEEVAPFNTVSDIRPFTYQYLSGYKAERYSIDGITCFRQAQAAMESSLRSAAHSDILGRGFDQARVTGFEARYKDVTYKSVLLPLYTARYAYQGKEYHYAINGQTGRVSGNYPKSAAKITAAVAVGLLLLFGLMYLFGLDDSSGGGEYGWEPGYSYYYGGAASGAAELGLADSADSESIAP